MVRKIYLVFSVFLFLFACYSAQAEPDPLAEIFHWSYGESRVVRFAGESVYLGTGTRILELIPSANGYSTQKIFLTEGIITDLVVHNDFLFAASFGKGLYVFNRHKDDSQPLAHLQHIPNIWDIYPADGKLFLSAGLQGLYCLDISTFEELFHLEPQKAIWQTIFHGGALYIIDGLAQANLFVIELKKELEPLRQDVEIKYQLDLSDSPSWLQGLSIFDEPLFLPEPGLEEQESFPLFIPQVKTVFSFRHLTTINRGNQINSIAVCGNNLYIADGPGGLVVYDISEPAFPDFIRGVDFSSLGRLTSIKEKSYSLVLPGTDFLFAVGQTEVHIFKEHDSHIEFITSYPLPGIPTRKNPNEKPNFIGFQAGRLAFAGGPAGLHILSIKQDKDPENIYSLLIPCRIESIAFKDNRFFISSLQGIWEIAGDALDNPHRWRRIPLPGICNDLIINDDYLYSLLGAGIGIIDIATPSELELVRFIPFPYPQGRPDITKGWLEEMALVEDLLFAAAGPGGLWILDCHDPSSPQPVTLVELTDRITALAADSDRTYVYAMGEHLHILDVQQPQNPRYITRIPLTGNTGKGVYREGYLFISLMDAGEYSPYLIIYDVSSPLHPKPVATIPQPSGTTEHLSVSGHLLLQAWTDGLQVYDISNPQMPHSIRSLSTPDIATYTYQQENLFLTSTYNAGFLLFLLKQ